MSAKMLDDPAAECQPLFGGSRSLLLSPMTDSRAHARDAPRALRVLPVEPADAAVWTAMRRALWPDGSADEHRDEVEQYFAGEFPRGPWIALIAWRGGEAVGMAEVSIRPYAEGCATSHVAYLEGWFVGDSARRQGVGRALVTAAESWGRAQGCVEFASDAAPDNAVSVAAHRAVGFADAGLVRCFAKRL